MFFWLQFAKMVLQLLFKRGKYFRICFLLYLVIILFVCLLWYKPVLPITYSHSLKPSVLFKNSQKSKASSIERGQNEYFLLASGLDLWIDIGGNNSARGRVDNIHMSHDTPYVDDGGRSINVKLHQPSQMFIYPPHKIPIEQCAVTAIATASRGSYDISGA